MTQYIPFNEQDYGYRNELEQILFEYIVATAPNQTLTFDWAAVEYVLENSHNAQKVVQMQEFPDGSITFSFKDKDKDNPYPYGSGIAYHVITDSKINIEKLLDELFGATNAEPDPA